MTPFDLTAVVDAVGSNIATKSGNWVGAIVAALVGAVFAAGRSTLGSAPPSRVSALVDETKGAAHEALERYQRNPSRTQSRWLVGRVSCTALTAVLIAGAVSSLPFTWAVVVSLLGTMVTYGLFAEIATTLAHRNPDRALPVLLRVLRPFELLFAPVGAPLAAISGLIARWLPAPSPVDGRTTEHEVELLLAEGAKSGTLGEERAEMIQNVLEFTDLTAVEVMVPRTSLTALAVDTRLDDVLKAIILNGHSRYPVYRGSIDNVVGLLYAKDLFKVMNDASARGEPVSRYMRTPVNFVPETQPVSALLREMRARQAHMAVVVDDYGGVSGIVTLEDIVEEIIGDIQDEHDAEENPIVDLGDGRVMVNAAMPVDDLARFLDVEIPDEGDFVSVGGMVVSRAGHVPASGAEVEAFGLKFIVREADKRRVSKLEVSRIPQPESSSGEPRRSPVPNGSST
ncbi:MAG: HlyC/CorC family transporter [Deltaproteobacteria bacterium]|nr:HlyC/CorC family transporter [Deltaproteobacteria bacterium]